MYNSDEMLFGKIRKNLDKYERIVRKHNSGNTLSESEDDWLDNYPLKMATAIYNELPEFEKVTKLLYIMLDDKE